MPSKLHDGPRENGNPVEVQTNADAASKPMVEVQTNVLLARPEHVIGPDAAHEGAQSENGQEPDRRKRGRHRGGSNGGMDLDANGKLTANGWENSKFSSAEQRGKFLRLMGGQRFAAAAQAACAGDDDIPTDLPTYELTAGAWVQNLDDEEAQAEVPGHADPRGDELQKLFSQGVQQMGHRRRGLGSV